MKGLLIKDFKLLLGQKRFFIIVVGMGLLFIITKSNPSTGISYITMLLTIFTLSTISYDEFDNGMAYLLTLPVNRKTYVTEKYAFAALIALVAAAGSVVIAILSAVFQKTAFDVKEIVATGVSMVLMSLVILAVTLPLQIKFGAEKGRIAMAAALGAVTAIILALGKIIETVGADISGIVAFFEKTPLESLVLIVVFAIILVLLASYFICVRIIIKKEY